MEPLERAAAPWSNAPFDHAEDRALERQRESASSAPRSRGARDAAAPPCRSCPQICSNSFLPTKPASRPPTDAEGDEEDLATTGFVPSAQRGLNDGARRAAYDLSFAAWQWTSTRQSSSRTSSSARARCRWSSTSGPSGAVRAACSPRLWSGSPRSLGGKVDLVKVDVDANQDLAARLRRAGHSRREGVPRRRGRGRVRRRAAGSRRWSASSTSWCPPRPMRSSPTGDEQSLRRALELEPRQRRRGHGARPHRCSHEAMSQEALALLEPGEGRLRRRGSRGPGAQLELSGDAADGDRSARRPRCACRRRRTREALERLDGRARERRRRGRRARDQIRQRRWSALFAELGPTTRSRASTAAGSPRPCTERAGCLAPSVLIATRDRDRSITTGRVGRPSALERASIALARPPCPLRHLAEQRIVGPAGPRPRPSRRRTGCPRCPAAPSPPFAIATTPSE